MENLVKITGDTFIVDLLYASLKQNMTGVAVYQEMGLGNNAYVHKDVWELLQKLVPILKERKQKLKIFDAFRPQEAHRRLFAVIPQDGFFIPEPIKSPHCHATAIDVCLTDENGVELEYPTLVDAYDEYFAKEVQAGRIDEFFASLKKARFDYMEASDTAIANRQELLDLMKSVGFVPVPRMHEWWHFELPNGRDNDLYPLI